MTFWSLILEPAKKYSQNVKESFHLSMASLDLSTVPVNSKAENFPVQLNIDSETLILCNLSKDLHPQVQLDLNFDKGTSLTFFTTGKAAIHLTGYVCDLEGPYDFDDSSDEENSEDVDSKTVNKRVNLTKRKASNENSKSSESKKPKIREEAFPTSNSSADDDSDDETEELTDYTDEETMATSYNSDDGSDSGEDDSDDESSADDDDDDDDESTDDSDSDIPKKGKSVNAQTITPNQNKKKASITLPNSSKKTPGSDKKTPNQGLTSNKKENRKGSTQSNGTITPASVKKKKGNDDLKSDNKTTSPKSTPKKQTLQGGVVVEELKEGNGPVAKPGKMVNVYYTGRLLSNNHVFDKTNQGTGFKFRLGRGDVIKGLDIALNGMKVGSKRKITIPPSMAYGNKGQPPAVPPNSTLIFDVEIRSVN